MTESTLVLSEFVTVRPVQNEADYRYALAEIEQLMGKVKRGTPEGARFEILLAMVEAYENEHYAIEMPDDPIGMIEFVLEQRGLMRKDLIPMMGSRQRVWEVMEKRRGLSKEMIRRLDAELGIPAVVLLQEYELYDKTA
ncbi:MAG: hypothetical protein R3A44_24450 [Caldilineaceae bacterium]